MHFPNFIKSCKQITRKQTQSNWFRNRFLERIFLKIDDRIPVDLMPVVYCTAIAEGSENEWNLLWNKFKLGNVASEQATILNALGCSKKNRFDKGK